MSRFADKVVIVTGAGSGIGRATAVSFAEEGALVAVVDIELQKAKKTAAEIANMEGNVLAIQADVANEDDWIDVVARVKGKYGRINILFNNAGIGGVGKPLIELDASAWDRLMAVNLRGVFLGCKTVLPALIEAGGGAIINMSSSTAGWDTIYGGGAYMASKAGVSQITKNVALEAAQFGIRVNAVCPGIIETRLSSAQAGADEAAQDAFFDRFRQRIPLGRVGQPKDVAMAVLFLASNEARHITGSTLLIDGGQTLQSWSNAPSDPYIPHAIIGPEQ
ncbi:MAG: SDR family oxidoreductase [Chloroflexi bacterium]|nr:SDR family oxidoreductase [Chloroflexota bacterium]